MNDSRAEKRSEMSINAKNSSERIVCAHRNKSECPLLWIEGKQMRKLTVGLIVLITALLLSTSLVAAHNTTTEHDASEMNSTEQGDWMKEHMTERMGEDGAESMRERMGMSYEEMDGMMNDGHMNRMMDGMDSGMGCH